MGRLAVLAPVDRDVEHVDLAIRGLHRPVGAGVHADVAQLARALLGDGHRADDVDAQLVGRLAHPAHRRAVERVGPGAQLLGRAEHVPLLGQHDELRAVGGRRAYVAVGRRAIGGWVGTGVELDGRGAH